MEHKGNSKSVYVQMGASNHVPEEREPLDYYATDPKAVDLLLEKETFNNHIWEPAARGGHIAERLIARGYDVFSSDIYDHGFAGLNAKIDFLSIADDKINTHDIVTNPPYGHAAEFVEKALDISQHGVKVAMFLKLSFLEGKARKKLFAKYPPRVVYVSSSRLKCGKGGDFSGKNSSAIAFAWFVWVKGHSGDPVIKWIN